MEGVDSQNPSLNNILEQLDVSKITKDGQTRRKLLNKEDAKINSTSHGFSSSTRSYHGRISFWLFPTLQCYQLIKTLYQNN